ncbi:MAG: hypothetical protein GC193_08295 [Cryomorphaceae bacterium]|nr:hypothetical protein [Cryomorphaceae bacterium]
MNRLIFYFVAIVIFASCKKEEVVFENNDIPEYDGIPTLLVQNYVNRLFIDLIGREPLDTEMNAEVAALETAGLSFTARTDLANRLIYSTNYLAGDSSYNYAYHVKLYENAKARLLEGASDAYIYSEYGIFRNAAVNDSAGGNFTGYELNMAQANRLLDIIYSREELRMGEIDIDEMFRRMMYNSIYDQINMNSFNFVNATFNDLYYRFPTQSEFEHAYNIIEFNQPAELFGNIIQNKTEYLETLTQNQEYFEGMIQWAYQSLLSRDAQTSEVFQLSGTFMSDKNFQTVQLKILISDEYAGFN